jgi:glycosyltransferase involved in cell wall biosynthesis
VAHAAMAGSCTLVAICAKLEHGAAFMLTEHGIYLREAYLAAAASSDSLFLKLLRLRFARRITELSYATADQISPCCDYNKRWELRLGAEPERVRTLYYGVDSTEFTPTEKSPSEKPSVVVWVGRINPLKDLRTLVESAKLVNVERPDVRFLLFGSAASEDEGYHQEILALRAQLGLEDTIIFRGYVAQPAAAYNEGDIVILSSLSEAFPFSILEAMLCAKPVVATAVGGIPEQIEGCGIAVEPRSPVAMARGAACSC